MDESTMAGKAPTARKGEDRQQVLFVHPGDRNNRLGGARLRWDALTAAMNRSVSVTRFQVECTDECADHPTGPSVLPTSGWIPDEDPYWYNYCPRVARRLAEVAADREWALVVASGTEMTRYLSEVPATVSARRVLDVRDVESRLRLEMARVTRDRPHQVLLASEESSRQLAALELAAMRNCDAIWTCTRDDKQTLVELYPITADRIFVLPNAVVDPGPAALSVPERIVFIGNLRYFPNVEAAEFIVSELAPALRAARPQLQVLLAGARPDEALLTSARAAGVAVADTPQDIEPYWSKSILAAPLHLGGGSRVKILEAFVRGCPVVSTAKGAEGLPAEPGRHYLLAESAEEYVEAVGRLLDDHAFRETLTAAAREFALEHNSIPAVSDAFERFRGALGTRQATTPLPG